MEALCFWSLREQRIAYWIGEITRTFHGELCLINYIRSNGTYSDMGSSCYVTDVQLYFKNAYYIKQNLIYIDRVSSPFWFRMIYCFLNNKKIPHDSYYWHGKFYCKKLFTLYCKKCLCKYQKNSGNLAVKNRDRCKLTETN